MAATKLSVYQAALRHLADARLNVITDDVTSRYALDDSWDAAVAFVLEQAAWRFAIKTLGLVSGGTPVPGYSNSFTYPTDWVRTHAIFAVSGALECPIDIREERTGISANVAALTIREVSSDFADPALSGHPWPEHFAEVVAAYLAFLVAARVTGDRTAPARMSEIFSSLLPDAIAKEALPESPWMPFQLDGRLLRGGRQVLLAGWWRFAMVTAAASAGGAALPGFSHSWAIPADWIRTHSLFVASGDAECPVDAREQGANWSTNVAAMSVRYVSSTPGLDATKWPEAFQNTVLAFLLLEESGGHAPRQGEDPKSAAAGAYQAALSDALAALSLPASPWLQYQLDGRFERGARAMLNQGGWRFALKTAAISVTSGVPAAGFANSFAVPGDWLRTQAVYVLSGALECPFDLREQAGFWSANIAAFTARYVSSTVDATLWPELFAKAVLSFLQYQSSDEYERGGNAGYRQDPQAAPSRAAIWRDDLAAALAALALPPSPWLEFQLDGRLPRAAREVVSLGFWRFALKEATLAVHTGVAATALSYAFAIPADWLRTQAIFTTAKGFECPLDAREEAGTWSADLAAITVRYLSATPLGDATLWPEPFLKAVLAFLQFERDRETQAAKAAEEAWQSGLAAGLAVAALPEPQFLRAQLDGRLKRAARQVLTAGFWRFALTTIAAPAPSGTPATGFSFSFAQPADWLRTRALHIAAGGRECPFDIREHAGFWSANLNSFATEYLSATLGFDSTLWPEPFATAVLALLAAEEEPAGAAEKGGADQYGTALAAGLAAAADPPDPWLQHQLDGTFQRVAGTMVDAAYWRFALVTTAISLPAGDGDGGLALKYAVPADAARTRALYRLAADGRRCPFDIREHAGFWHSNATSFYAQYLSRARAMDSTQWPDHYMRAVLRQIEFDRANRGDANDQQVDNAAWKDALADTLDSEADPPDPWLQYQLDGTFDRAARAVIARGNWTFAGALKELPVDAQKAEDAAAGFSYRFALPADLLKTHALYRAWDGQTCPINIRQDALEWSTDAPMFTARYISTAALDATTWPEPVAAAVLAWLDWRGDDNAPAEKRGGAATAGEALFERLLLAALAAHSIPDDPWLRFQLDGRFIQAAKMLLEKGRWRFAVKTVTLSDPNNPAGSANNPPAAGAPNADSDGSVSPGYSCRLVKPDDLLRTLRLYFSLSDGLRARWYDIDYRDELGAFHANYTPLVLRYVSRLGLDATRWPANFRDSVLAWLEHVEARADPKLAGVAAERLKFYQLQCSEAEGLDDESDLPRRESVGRFVAGRWGRGAQSREEGWPPFGPGL